ncbi:MAG: hypothetical protein JWQ38_2951 [Flavipsychrobacter sp.]|nr:hypothetical protein [Flavipsychrobacter sp.]
MPASRSYDTIPLTIVYILLIVMALYYSTRGIDTRSKYTGEVIGKWEENEDSKYVSRTGMWVINLVWLEAIVISTGVYFLVKRILPYKKDANSGIKEKVPYEIIRKEYFPLTDQYYFALDDPNYLHHEVDAVFFSSCNEGDSIFVYRAIRSKFVFEANGRFSIL